MEEQLTVEIAPSYLEVDAAAWDALTVGASPFLESTFLFGLEAFGCAVPETGWGPRPILVKRGGKLIAAAPAWVKGHSMGEFVYDHAWADAARRNQIDYYPKVVVGVPFTPATGGRFLIHPDETNPESLYPALLAGLQAVSKNAGGLHVLFPREAEADWLAEAGMFTRLQYQFHWLNQGYEDFEAFLSTFKSKKRNKVRRERKAVAAYEYRAETHPGADELAALHRFYARTCSQFGPWGRVYMSPEFFAYLGEKWGHRLLPVLAYKGGKLVGGTFNVVGHDRLYGRHWGCEDDAEFLHFEVCYYQAIEACIAHGIGVFEPGHGGGHKYRRGFTPTLTYSSHYVNHQGLHEALAAHTLRECEAVRSDLEELCSR